MAKGLSGMEEENQERVGSQVARKESVPRKKEAGPLRPVLLGDQVTGERVLLAEASSTR